jgi:hypothetical protein
MRPSGAFRLDFRIGQHRIASRTQPAERLLPLLIDPVVYLYQSDYWTAVAAHVSAVAAGKLLIRVDRATLLNNKDLS